MIKMGIGSLLCDMNGKILSMNAEIEFQFSHILSLVEEPSLFHLLQESLGSEILESLFEMIEDCGEFQIYSSLLHSSNSWTNVSLFGQALTQHKGSRENQFMLILISPSTLAKQNYQYTRPYSHMGDPETDKVVDKVIITDEKLKIVENLSSRFCKERLDHSLRKVNSVLDHFPHVEAFNLQVAASRVLRTGNPQRLTAMNIEGSRCLVSVFNTAEIPNKAKLVWLIVDESHISKNVSEISKANSLFVQLADSISDVFWVFDTEITSIIYISPSYSKIWGRSTENLYSNSKDFIEAIHHDDISLMYDAMNSQMKGIKTEIEYRVIRPDGSMKWVRDRAFPIRGSSGNIRFITGLAEDITAEKIQSLELASIESRMIKLNDHLPTGILRLNQNLDILDANKAATKMLNSSLQDLKHRSIFDFFDEFEVFSQISNWIQEGGFENIEITTQLKGSHQKSLDALVKFIKEDVNSPNSYLVIVTDITLLSKSINDLSDAKSQMEFVMESGLSGHWEYNLDDRKIKLSQGCAEILGNNIQEGSHFIKEVIKYVSKSSRRNIYTKSRELITDSANHGKFLSLEVMIKVPSGENQYLLNNIKLFERRHKQKNYKVLTGLVTDITAQRRAEQAARNYKNQITDSELGNSKIEILAAIAHEINQPLFAIQNFSISLRNHFTNNSSWNVDDKDLANTVDELIENIIRQSERGGQIIRRLRDLASEKQQIHSPIDLHEQILTIYQFREVYLQSESIDFSLELNAEKHFCIGDEMKFQLILINLIKNASEALRDIIENTKPNERSGKIIISTYTDKDDFIVAIKDQGGGIEDTSANIYSAFYSTKQGGMGIGLSICKSIVESVNGRIWHENIVGQGVTFYLAFKLINANKIPVGHN